MLVDAYCTVTEADSVITDSDDWDNLDDTEKETALSWGRVYIDSKYSCSTIEETDDDYDDYQNALKVANAILGDQYARGNLFSISPTGNRVITETSVKAGSVSSSKKYSSSNGDAVVDPFPDVTGLLAPYCTSLIGTFSSINLVRA